MKVIFGKCGCNCGKCSAYQENARTAKARHYCSEGWTKYLGVRLKPEICYCEGCQAPDPWKSGNLLPTRGCILRVCAIKMGIENCAYCPFCPCEELQAVIPDENFRERVAKRIGTAIPKADYHAFIEPYEGLKHLTQIRATLKKKDIARKPAVNPLPIKFVEFPTDWSSSKPSIKAFKSIHTLLTNILRARAETYARQLVIKNRRYLILNLLWVFGLYGEFKGKYLMIDGKVCRSLPEFNNLVRKYDNTLHHFLQQSVKIIKKIGIQVELLPVGKNWLLKLTLAKHAGAVPVLKALKIYVTKLVQKYGKPVHVGASRFKGKAFVLFSTADMKILRRLS